MKISVAFFTSKGKFRNAKSDVERDRKGRHGAISGGVRELRSRILLINNAVMGVRVEEVASKCGGTEKAALFTPAGGWLAVTSLKSRGK